MKILKTNVLRGPNYWSNYRKKLIVIQLDLEKYEYFPTNLLPGFTDNLKKILPSLIAHGCSIGGEGGFFQRLEEGTWLGHVIEHIALELQTLAGMDCGFGRTYRTEVTGVYDVIFSYEIENAGLYAGEAALALVESLAQGKDYMYLNRDIDYLHQIWQNEKFGPSTAALIDEAKKRGISYFKSKTNSLIIFGQGVRQKKIWATVCDNTSAIGMDIAANKDLTKEILASYLLPVPEGTIVSSKEAFIAAVNTLGFPAVVKPYNGNHGRGITTNITTLEKAITGFEIAHLIAPQVIVERYITGFDYRILVVNYKVIAVALRTPAHVIGTGEHSIEALIEMTNQDPKRGESHENFLSKIKVDEITMSILVDGKLTMESVLDKGQILYLKNAANLSSGGTATDVTDEIHPSNVQLAERAARIIGLDVCGIDIIAEDISFPITDGKGAIIEVNASPGLRMHLAPDIGEPRNVAKPIIDLMYPSDSSSTIPIIAVTGTNGKTTVVRLISHMAKHAQYNVGFTSTEGIYINNEMIYEGDCSGPSSADIVLQDPWVNFAVLECARGGILRAGLGFDECNVSIITNITGDHLGINGINTLEELKDVKAVVARSTRKDGYALLNAEDDLVFSLMDGLDCKIGLFGLKENTRIQAHCETGGLAAYIEKNNIIICNERQKKVLMNIESIPLTFAGKVSCMIKNVLPAVLAGLISGFSEEHIVQALHSFVPSVENTPGRMNLFKFDGFQVLLDYAHNEGAYIEIKNYLSSIKCDKKIGIISATGDRRPEDIQQLGYHSAQMFDEIIIKHNRDGRGKSDHELTSYLLEGINRVNPASKVHVISNELEALRYAMQIAIPQTFIFYSADNVGDAIQYIKNQTSHFQFLGASINES